MKKYAPPFVVFPEPEVSSLHCTNTVFTAPPESPLLNFCACAFVIYRSSSAVSVTPVPGRQVALQYVSLF